MPVIPYQKPSAKEAASDMSGTLSSTLPMAAMFTRNKFMGWYVYIMELDGLQSDGYQDICRLCDPELAWRK